MTWQRGDLPNAFMEAGIWQAVYANIAFNATGQVLARGRVRAADALFLENRVQATDYVFRYVTNELPGLNVGDAIDYLGVQYKLLDAPKLEPSDGFFSNARVERLARVYPKAAINMGDNGVAQQVLGDMLNRVANANLAAFRIVRSVNATRVDYVDNTNAAHATSVLGFTVAAATLNQQVLVQNSRELTNPAWTWTPDRPIWIGANGLGTQSVIVSPARFVQRVAFAITATKIFIEIEPPVYLR